MLQLVPFMQGQPLFSLFPFYPGKCFNAIQCFLVMRLQTPSYHAVEDRDTAKGKLSLPASHDSLLFLLQALAALKNQCADAWQQAGAICSCDWWIFYSQYCYTVMMSRHRASDLKLPGKRTSWLFELYYWNSFEDLVIQPCLLMANISTVRS